MTGGNGSQRAAPDVRAFAAIFDAHAAHLFDYCRSLLGSADAAAGAAAATLITASALAGPLQDPGRMRAWLLALARRECLSSAPARAELTGLGLPRVPADDADTDPHGLPLPPGAGLSAAHREVLDLLDRHGISPDDLPAVLGIPPPQAADLVTAARGGEEPATERPALPLATLPLATLPRAVWQASARMLLDPDLRPQREAVIARSGPFRPDGFPAGPAGPRGLAGAYGRGRLRLAGLVLIPAAAGIAVVLYFTLGRDGPGSRPLVPPGAAPSPPAVAAVRPSVPARLPIGSLFPARRAHPVLPLLPAPTPSSVPTLPPTRSPRPSSPATTPAFSPPPSSVPPSTAPPPSATPTPSPTPPPSPSPSPTPSPTGGD
jgi:DNA-directed RNA polymerase specialized sigma24 family protein